MSTASGSTSNPERAYAHMRAEIDRLTAQVYLRVNTSIGGPIPQILCISNLLTGKAFEWWEPTLRDYLDNERDSDRDEETNIIFQSYDNFEHALRTAFGDPDEAKTATRQLKNLRQTGSATHYNREFRVLSSKLDLGDNALMEYFYDGLKEDVKDDLSKLDKPERFDEYVEMAIKIDNRNYQRRLERGNKGGRNIKVQITEKRVNSKKRDTPSNESKEALRIYVITKEPKPVRSERIPEEYRQYGKLFSDELETGLPEHSRWDHEIRLEPGSKPRIHKIYPLNEEKTKALKEYLAENLKKGYIRPSTSPAGFPILFVPKKNGKLRMCVDYRQLNNITIKNRYPLPLITELQDKLHGAKYFTTLDLKGAYNLIRIKEGEEWKTAFRTRQGLYEYLVMPFGLTNAPASFQTMINDVLREYLDIFVVIYLDDILIFSENLEKHR
ncbi:pol protein [Purpureocillium lilacinum]|uniref:Pol protein n=1 Tax=Purpureocillium lilacinum TaxID=33203 RepID=A0A179FFF4_PURLI|nr:pol protein [Purpureocillium lilacinum]OAQ63783.1 pol protein [Purpureocillium lilacinum]